MANRKVAPQLCIARWQRNFMNPYGSYRALRDNAISAMVASIEVYNKPMMQYRSENFVILLANAWELVLKAMLSKNRQRIFYSKERKKPYMTLSLFDALEAAESFFPATIPYKAVAENIERIVEYRNNAIHFYNEESFDVLIYGLSQTSIVNFRDLVHAVFDVDVAERINLCLLPLSFANPPDPIQFLRNGVHSKNKSVAEYLKLICDTATELEQEGIDTGRFLTVFEVNLQSTKKVTSADVIAGISSGPSSAQIVTRKVDPNKSHPLLRMHIMNKIGKALNGHRFTTNTFEAIAWFHKIKENPRFYWKADTGGSSHYSHDTIAFLKSLTESQIETCVRGYRDRNKDANQ